MEFTDLDIENICVQAIKEYLNKPLTDEEVKSKYRVALMYMVEEAKEILRNTKRLMTVFKVKLSLVYCAY